jgi:hypothetical protein
MTVAHILWLSIAYWLICIAFICLCKRLLP